MHVRYMRDDPTCSIYNSLNLTALFQGLEGYSRDPGFGLNMVRDSGKRKISWRDSGFDCYQGSGICQNLGMGCEILFACLSGIREIATTQVRLRFSEGFVSVERCIDFMNFCVKQGIVTRPYVFVIYRNLTTSWIFTVCQCTAYWNNKQSPASPF